MYGPGTFIYELALRLGLRGFVRNEADGVTIEVEGESASSGTEFLIRSIEIREPGK